MTDEKINELLVEALKKVVPVVREGIYTGEDCDRYATFTYYVRGLHYANNRPTAKSWRVTVTLWVRKGVSVYRERTLMKQIIEELSGEYPTCEVATDDGWQQYVYEFTYIGGVEEWAIL